MKEKKRENDVLVLWKNNNRRKRKKMGKMIDIINEKNMLSVHVGEFRAIYFFNWKGWGVFAIWLRFKWYYRNGISFDTRSSVKYSKKGFQIYIYKIWRWTNGIRVFLLQKLYNGLSYLFFMNKTKLVVINTTSFVLLDNQ